MGSSDRDRQAILDWLARLPRRDFLRLGAAGVLALGCHRSVPAIVDAPPPDAPARPLPPAGKVLDERAWRTLEAMTSRLLPSDDGPGAREAGVIAFLDAQLATAALTKIASLIVLAADVLDRWAKVQHSLPFVDLDASEQDHIIDAFARGQIPTKSYPQREVFRALHSLTLEGFLSDPAHGGNANQAGWRAINFTAPERHPHGHH